MYRFTPNTGDKYHQGRDVSASMADADKSLRYLLITGLQIKPSPSAIWSGKEWICSDNVQTAIWSGMAWICFDNVQTAIWSGKTSKWIHFGSQLCLPMSERDLIETDSSIPIFTFFAYNNAWVRAVHQFYFFHKIHVFLCMCPPCIRLFTRWAGGETLRQDCMLHAACTFTLWSRGKMLSPVHCIKHPSLFRQTAGHWPAPAWWPPWGPCDTCWPADLQRPGRSCSAPPADVSPMPCVPSGLHQ